MLLTLALLQRCSRSYKALSYGTLNESGDEDGTETNLEASSVVNSKMKARRFCSS